MSLEQQLEVLNANIGTLNETLGALIEAGQVAPAPAPIEGGKPEAEHVSLDRQIKPLTKTGAANNKKKAAKKKAGKKKAAAGGVMDFDALKGLIIKTANAVGAEKVRELFEAYGVVRAQELEEDSYEDFAQELRDILDEATDD